MKKVVIPAVALLLGAASAHAQSIQDFQYGLQEIEVAPFEKIRINANVQVVLVQTHSVKKVFVEGDQKLLKNVSVTTENGELVINPTANAAGVENLLITIAIDKVKQVAFKGDAKVQTVAGL